MVSMALPVNDRVNAMHAYGIVHPGLIACDSNNLINDIQEELPSWTSVDFGKLVSEGMETDGIGTERGFEAGADTGI